MAQLSVSFLDDPIKSFFGCTGQELTSVNSFSRLAWSRCLSMLRNQAVSSGVSTSSQPRRPSMALDGPRKRAPIMASHGARYTKIVYRFEKRPFRRVDIESAEVLPRDDLHFRLKRTGRREKERDRCRVADEILRDSCTENVNLSRGFFTLAKSRGIIRCTREEAATLLNTVLFFPPSAPPLFHYLRKRSEAPRIETTAADVPRN